LSDLLGSGAAWLERQRDTFLTRMVRYRRGTDEIPVRATIGRTVFEVATLGGVIERIEARDYLIPAKALIVFGSPHRGDVVSEVADGIRHLYEVLAPGREPHWRWSDPNRTLYRIHTKFLQSEVGT
jgi:hypothetical protein